MIGSSFPVEEVGSFIRDIRTARGLTQAQLGERIGSSRNWVCQLENGAHKPSLRTLAAIGEACGVEVWLDA